MSLSKIPKPGALARAGTEPKPEQEPEQESEVECDDCYRVFSKRAWYEEKKLICYLVEKWADKKPKNPLEPTPSEKADVVLEENHCSKCSSFVCSDCGERKANCEEGSKPLYEGVCIDCSRCPHCGCAMWDYECGVCLQAGRAGR